MTHTLPGPEGPRCTAANLAVFITVKFEDVKQNTSANLRHKIFPARSQETKGPVLILSVIKPNGNYLGYFVTFLYSLQTATLN